MIDMTEQAKEVSELLKVLANEHRLLILCALLDGPLAVSEISGRVRGIGQSAVSQHLARLKALGILSSNKKGQHVFYEIADHRVEKVLTALKEEYCS